VPGPDRPGGTDRPAGTQPKVPPAVIVTPTDDIRPDGEVWVVGISTQIAAAPAEVQVELPWHAQKHPKTGLRERCAAVSTWLTRMPVSAIQSEAGSVPGPHLARILGLVGSLPAEPSESPSHETEPP
jgi:hypothetical protein